MTHRNTFERYDSAAAQLAELHGVEEALQVACTSRTEVANRLARTTQEIAHVRQRAQHHKMKIERCKNHPLLKHTALQPGTWFKGGIGERIKRQQDKLSEKEAEEAGLATSERRLESQASSLETNVRALRAALARKQSSEVECSQIIESVAAGNPTAALASMQQQQAQWEQAAAAERQNVERVASIARSLGRAKAAYQQAGQSLQRAGSANTGAQFNNFLGGNSFGFELVEHVQQAQRNQLMAQARQRVHEGAQLMQSISVSASLVQRFPELARLREVHVPTVEQAGLGEGFLEIFGGDFGDAIAGFTAANKISRSIGVVRQCLGIVDTQERAARAAQHALESSVREMEVMLQRVAHDVANEKRNIFDAVRSRIMGGATPPALPPAYPCDAKRHHHQESSTVPVAVATTVPYGGANLPTATPAAFSAHNGPVAVATPIAVAVGVQVPA